MTCKQTLTSNARFVDTPAPAALQRACHGLYRACHNVCSASDTSLTRCSMYTVPLQHVSRMPAASRQVCCSNQADDQRVNSEPSTSGEPLPSVSRQQIFASCSSVSATLAAIAAGLRVVAPATSVGIFKSDPGAVQALLQFGSKENVQHLLIMLATVAVVTGARLALLSSWPAFAEASDRSNQQVLTPLNRADLIWLSCLPGISEELLFRGAVIPATLPDWRGAILSAAIFGVLHNNGGRNWAFAGWAGAVGLLYGTAFLGTQDLLVPAGAHCMANYLSATLWLRSRPHAS